MQPVPVIRYSMKNMKAKKLVHYDRESDVFSIGMKGIEEEYVEVMPGIGAELDENGRVVGIEILNASKIFQPIAKSIRQKTLSATN